MDSRQPVEIMDDFLRAAKHKASLKISDMLLRGALAGAYLGFATSLAFVTTAQGLSPIVGAVLFPVGFVMLVLLGFELATGNFALLPPAVAAKEIRWTQMLRNWFWVYLGNLAGSLFYAALFYLAITNCGANNGAALGDLVRAAAQKKTLGYMAAGHSGWATAFIKALLCNWMVTVGTLLAFASRSTIGKVIAMWLPITTFFAQGYEHSIVNMFVIPAGKLLGTQVSVRDWWLWNQIPVTLGNIVAGALFTGLAMYATYGRKQSASSPATARTPLEEPEAVSVGAA